MVCSTCDGYQLVDSDGDGVIDAACPDCRSNVQRCPVHGRTMVAGHCRVCVQQARRGTAILLERAREAAELHGAAVMPT